MKRRTILIISILLLGFSWLRHYLTFVYKNDYDIGGSVEDMLLMEDYAYVATEQKGLQVYDLSNPLNFQLITEVQGVENPNALTFFHPYVYVISQDGSLRILDVSKPSEPSTVGEFRLLHRVFAPSSWDITLISDYVVLVNHWHGLFIIDVSNPGQPIEVAHLITGVSRSVSNVGGYIYLGGDSLKVIDISSVESPHIIWESEPDFYIQDMVVEGNYLYMASGNNLHILNVVNPKSPIFVNKVSARDIALGVDILDNIAFVSELNSLRILDVSNPESPKEIYWKSFTQIRKAFAMNNYVYVAGDLSEEDIQIFKFRNP